MNTRKTTIQNNGNRIVDLISEESDHQSIQTVAVPEVDLSVSVENMMAKQVDASQKLIEKTEKIFQNSSGEVDFEDVSSITFSPDGTVQIANKRHFRFSKD